MRDILERLVDRLSAGEKTVLVTIVAHEGSTPRTAGSKMLVAPDASLIAGSVGGGVLEAAALKAAPQVLADGMPEVMDFDMSGEMAANADMICGGRLKVLVEALSPADLPLFRSLLDKNAQGKEMILCTRLDGEERGRRLLIDPKDGDLPDAQQQEIRRAARGISNAVIMRTAEASFFVEVWPVTPRLILCGGGHVAQATVPVAARAGFDVIVMDDRAEFALPERFPEASLSKEVPHFDHCFDGIALDESAYVVILTRGHMHDAFVLHQLLEAGRNGRKAGYIGMIGSRRKKAEVYAALERRGITAEELARVHCPVGLPIGAETPAEIAISIVAECIAHRRQPRS